MNLIGKWKTKEILRFSAENGMEWKTLDELAAMGEDEDSLSPYRNSLIVFNEDGTMETLMPVPEDFTKEQIDALIAEGNEVRNGMAVIDKKKWKTEDGKNLCNSDVEGEIFGEEVSPWAEIKEVDDMIEIEFVRYGRAD